MIDYSKLNNRLKALGLNKSEMGKQLGISSRTIAKIARGEKLSRIVLQKMSDYLECNPEDLFEEKSDNPLLQVLREEKTAGISGGIYHELQVRMTYNSNHMEGSRLTEEQTRLIFETNTIDISDGIPVDDILETVHHFRAIDYCIDIADMSLSEDIIKKLHYIIKHDTKDSELTWFAVGEYKKRANMVGGKETAAPCEVETAVKKLLDGYLNKQNVTIEDIIAFHAEFEMIHPFQDGNGRVGRLIAFKECLKHNITPFIIDDSKKGFYYRGLSNWNTEKGYLIDTCLYGQDTVNALLNVFGMRDNHFEEDGEIISRDTIEQSNTTSRSNAVDVNNI